MATLRFSKMHGLGNDFMIIDLTSQEFDLKESTIKAMADRHCGIGFDQMLVIEKPDPGDEECDFRYRIFNADGGEVEQCGNGARCFMRYLVDKGLFSGESARVRTAKGVIEPRIDGDGLVEVDMGPPRFKPEEIPFVPADKSNPDAMQHMYVQGTISLPLSVVNMGNPHAVVIIDDFRNVPVELWGEMLEQDKASFPERVNVGFMKIVDRDLVELKVYERGTGPTRACGTGACAAMVTGARLGLLNERVVVRQPGGDLTIDWAPGRNVLMRGPATMVYDGVTDTDRFLEPFEEIRFGK